MTTTTRKTMRESTLPGKYARMEPCYLFDKQKFIDNVKELLEAFFDTGLRVRVGYSYKTNPAPQVLNVAKHIAMAEIVSPHELSLALQNGVDYWNMIYNGVIPDVEGKFAVASNGGIVNIENDTEFFQLEEYARRRNTPIAVGLRINIYLGRISRFGVERGSEEWQRIMLLVKKSDFIRIKGIHCHTYGGRDLESWKQKVTEACIAAKEVGAEYIDFGSNMYGDMDERLKSQFEGYIPCYGEYANVIKEGLDAHYSDEEYRPMVIIEPGTPVVGNTVSILAKVTNIRRIRDKWFVNTDCSIYDMGFVPLTRNVPMDVIHASHGRNYENIDIYGYTCTEGDVIHRGYSGELAIGDYLLFRNLGAYSNTIACPFIMEPLKMYEV